PREYTYPAPPARQAQRRRILPTPPLHHPIPRWPDDPIARSPPFRVLAPRPQRGEGVVVQAPLGPRHVEEGVVVGEREEGDASDEPPVETRSSTSTTRAPSSSRPSIWLPRPCPFALART